MSDLIDRLINTPQVAAYEGVRNRYSPQIFDRVQSIVAPTPQPPTRIGYRVELFVNDSLKS